MVLQMAQGERHHPDRDAVMTLYKVLDENGRSMHGGDAQWHLPMDGQPGEWMPAIEGTLVPCENGYHLCRLEHLPQWVGPAIWEAEYEGELLEDTDKMVVRWARLVRATVWSPLIAALWAADCAERVLRLYEKRYPNDSRPRDALAAARSGDPQAAAAARAARAAAARAAARAARASAAAAEAAEAAAGAAEAAAQAAEAAARAAGGAEVAARAARAAAGAARAAQGAEAARAARAAGAAAAWAAGAARAAQAAQAARAAEREWQVERLGQYLRGEAGV